MVQRQRLGGPRPRAHVERDVVDRAPSRAQPGRTTTFADQVHDEASKCGRAGSVPAGWWRSAAVGARARAPPRVDAALGWRGEPGGVTHRLTRGDETRFCQQARADALGSRAPACPDGPRARPRLAADAGPAGRGRDHAGAVLLPQRAAAGRGGGGLRGPRRARGRLARPRRSEQERDLEHGPRARGAVSRDPRRRAGPRAPHAHVVTRRRPDATTTCIVPA